MRKFIIIFILAFTQMLCGQGGNTLTVDQQAATDNPFLAQGYKSDEISARLKVLESRNDIVQSDKDKLTRLYTDSLDLVREIENLATLNIDYENRKKNAPDELVQIENKLAEGLAQPSQSDTAGLTLEQAEQNLAALQLEASQIQKDIVTLANEPQRRAARRTEIPAEVAALNDKLAKFTDKGAESESQIVLDEIRQATVMYNTLSQNAIRCKIISLETELAMYNARSELLNRQREYSDKRLQWISSQVSFWQEQVTNRRKDQAQEAKDQAETAVSEVAATEPILETISQQNLKIAEVQSELVDKIDEIGKELKQTEDDLKNLQSELDRTTKMVNEVGLTPAIGILLHNKLVNLPDANAKKQKLKKRLLEMSQSQFDLLDYDEKRANLAVISEAVAEMMLQASLPESQTRTELETKIEQLLIAQRSSLETLVKFYDNYTTTQSAIDVKDREYIAKLAEYENFINQHILWVKNTQPISFSGLKQILPEIRELFSVANWYGVWQALPKGLIQETSTSVSLWLLLLGVYLARFGNRKQLRQLAAKVASPEQDKYSYTMIALLLTVIYSLPIPMSLYVIGRTIEYGAGDTTFTHAFATALVSLSFYDFVMLPLRNIFMKEGLALSHFNIRPDRANFFYRFNTWFIIILQPLLFILYLQHELESSDWKYELNRLVFITTMLLFSTYLLIILYPDRRQDKTDKTQEVKLPILHYRNFMHVAAMVIPIALAVLAWQGYYYAAWQLQVRMFITFSMAIFFVLLNSLLVRRIYLARGNILAGFGQKHEKKTNIELADDDMSEEEVNEHCAQITRFVRFTLTFAHLITMFVIFKDVFPALAVLNNVNLWQVTDSDGSIRWVSLASLLSALTILVITIMMARNITGLINITLLKSISHKEGTRFAILALIRYVIVIFGVCWSFTSIGVGWDKVQWLAAAFTVGLGFGLQEIFANFVSGIILLFEQPMRVGDIVTVGEVSGRVTHINTRSTTINCWDRRELIIPNKEFITGKLMNWTLSDNLNRIVFSVGVAYGSDIAKVEKTLLRIARFQRGVVWKPKPQVIFKGFGQSCLDFDLRVYIDDMDNYVEVWHNINCTIDTEFRKESIEIAFPQQDLHIRSINCGPLPIRFEDGSIKKTQIDEPLKTNIEDTDNE